MTSFAPRVKTDDSGKWYLNNLRFGTEDEARRSASDLAARWIAVREYGAVETTDPVNYSYTEEGVLIAVKPAGDDDAR